MKETTDKQYALFRIDDDDVPWISPPSLTSDCEKYSLVAFVMSNGVTLQTLVLPIFRRYWLWHAWLDRAAIPGPPLRRWRDGSTLEERFQILGQSLSAKATRRLEVEWTKLESAKEGSLRNRVFRLAQAVLSREDPRETFLKEVAYGDVGKLDILYPSEMKEKLVRRRLRLLAVESIKRHRRRLLWWSLAAVPQIPLMLTPLPNVTVYYTGWRLYSHYQAMKGAKLLTHGFLEIDTMQLHAIRDELLLLKEEGVVFPAHSWPARLIQKEKKYLDIFDTFKRLQIQHRLTADLATQGGGGGREGSDVKKRTSPLEIQLTSSRQLSQIVRPGERLHAPLSDDAAMEISASFHTTHVLEMVAGARKKATGSMFVTQFPK